MAEPHVLTVAVDEAGVHEYRVECPGLVKGDCQTYTTCYPVPCDEDALDRLADSGDDDPEQHGVVHRRIDGEWMRENGECFVVTHPDLVDAARELSVPHSGAEVAAGRYEVDIEFQDHPRDLVLVLATRDNGSNPSETDR